MQHYKINNYLTKILHIGLCLPETQTPYTQSHACENCMEHTILQLQKPRNAHNFTHVVITLQYITTEHAFHARGRQDNSRFAEGT